MGGGEGVLGTPARVTLWVVLGLLGASASLTAQAFDFSLTDQELGGDWGRIDFSWNNKLTQGAAMRTSKIDERLIYKLNVPGQEQLCNSPIALGASTAQNADCISRTGDPAPSQALINARGTYNANIDDGDLNYGRGDITYADTQLRSELTGAWRNWSFKVSGIAYYDPVNSSFQTHYHDVLLPNRGAGQTVTLHRPSERSKDQERLLGRNVQLLDAYVAGDFSVAGHKLHLAVGDQELRWGESTFVLFNNLNQINPLSAELYRQPGSEVKDAFLPVGMFTASMDLTNEFSVSGFYQYDYKPDAPDVAGSFLSTQNVAGAGNGPTPVYLSLGQYPQDPLGQFVPGGQDAAVDYSSRTAYLKDQSYGYPHNGGQYGIRVDEYADWLNGGTDLSLYAMNIHSRLPYLSAYAANKACFTPYISDLTATNPTFFSKCYSMYNLPANTPVQVIEQRGLPYPVTTVQPFLDYPKDVHVFGASFNTKLFDWSLAGELVYTPNQPAQVQFVDVLYAALQPAFPDTHPGDQFGALPNYAGTLIEYPTNRLYAPDYLETSYRHHHVQPGDLVRGYERLKVGQLDFTGIRVFSSSNPINADQIIFVGELAAVKIFDMPPLDQLQFEGGAANDTHYSVGNADWNPSYNGVNGQRLVSPLDVLNPVRADPKIFATNFAWGYRLRTTATYNNVFWGITLQPEVEFHHDVQGTSIYPGQDFVKGRMELTTSNQFLFKHNISARFRYVMHMGAGDRNLLLDRDYAELSASYVF